MCVYLVVSASMHICVYHYGCCKAINNPFYYRSSPLVSGHCLEPLSCETWYLYTVALPIWTQFYNKQTRKHIGNVSPHYSAANCQYIYIYIYIYDLLPGDFLLLPVTFTSYRHLLRIWRPTTALKAVLIRILCWTLNFYLWHFGFHHQCHD